MTESDARSQLEVLGWFCVVMLYLLSGGWYMVYLKGLHRRGPVFRGLLGFPRLKAIVGFIAATLMAFYIATGLMR